jgi:hypothetical protein
MSSSLKNISNEEKLRIAKDIVVAYVGSSVRKKGEDTEPTLKTKDVCDLLKQVYKTVDEIAPLTEARVGLH